MFWNALTRLSKIEIHSNFTSLTPYFEHFPHWTAMSLQSNEFAVLRWQRWDRVLEEREQAWNRPQNVSCFTNTKPATKTPVRLKLITAKILAVETRVSFYLPVCLWHKVLKRCGIFLIWFSLLLSPPCLTRLSLLSSASPDRAPLGFMGNGVWTDSCVRYWRQFVGQPAVDSLDNFCGFQIGGYEWNEVCGKHFVKII